MTSSEGGASGRTFESLSRGSIRSDSVDHVQYSVQRIIGSGGFAYALLAQRHVAGGNMPVVLKVMRPEVVLESGDIVTRLFKKEVVALGRLNERAWPSPFVVRLLDTGVMLVSHDQRALELPWLAVEYVHGGLEGETLAKRVRYATKHTGQAFGPERAASALRQLTAALSDVHAVDVIHRDLKPSNVLCCGLGASEVMKISDFGIARPTGMVSTFGEVALGSPGYVAPEQVHLRDEIGPATDVFSLAAVVFFMLTGERYFGAKSAVDSVMAAAASERRSILESPSLATELRAWPDGCKAIDAALARATAGDPRHRFQSATELANWLLPTLDACGQGAGQASERLVSTLLETRKDGLVARDPSHFTWVTRHRPGGEAIVIDVAWESDGHGLAATPKGLSYWDGSSWTELSVPLWPIHMVRRLAAGRWLLSSNLGQLYEYSKGTLTERFTCPGGDQNIVALAGDLDDLVVMVGVREAAPPRLSARCGGHWLKPTLVEDAANIAAITQLEPEVWLVVGRGLDGRAFSATYHPLEWRLERGLQTPGPAFVCSASQPWLGLALFAGGCHVSRLGRQGRSDLELPTKSHWSACAVDPFGGSWVAGAGTLWFSPSEGAPWQEVWSDPGWRAPFVSIHADDGHVVLVTADGGVLEGRD